MFKKFDFWFLNALVGAIAFSTLLLVFLSDGVAQKVVRDFAPLEIISIIGLPILAVVFILWLLRFIDGRKVEVIAGNGILFVTIACIALYKLVGGNEALYFGAWLTSFGWIITNVVSIRNNRTNNTFGTLVELRTNQALHLHRMNIFSKIGYTTKLTNGDLERLIRERDDCENWKENIPVIESVTFLANLYDNIAYGVRHHDLDRHVVEKNIRNLIVFFFEDYYAFIEYHNKPNPKSLEHLIWLAKEFGAQPPQKG